MRHRLATLTVIIVMICLGLAAPASAAATETMPATSALAPDSEMPRNQELQSSEWSERIARDPAPTALLTLSCAQDADRPGWSTPVRLVEPPALGGWFLEVDVPVPGGSAAAAGYEYVLVAGDQVMHRTGCTTSTLWPWQEFPVGGSAIETGEDAITVLPEGVLGALLPGEEAPAAAPTTTTTSAATGSADGPVSPVAADGPAAEASTAAADPEAHLDTPELAETDRDRSGTAGGPSGLYWFAAVVVLASAGASRQRDRVLVADQMRTAARHPAAASLAGLAAIAGLAALAATGPSGTIRALAYTLPIAAVVAYTLAGRRAASGGYAGGIGVLVRSGWQSEPRRVAAWTAAGAALGWFVAAGAVRPAAALYVAMVAAAVAATAEGVRVEHVLAGQAAAVREQVAAVLGCSPLQIEQMGSVRVDPDRITVSPLPATAMRTAVSADLGDRVAAVMPGWQVAGATSSQVVLVPVDRHETERRAAVKASGGLVTGVAPSVTSSSPSTAAGDVPTLIFDPTEEV